MLYVRIANDRAVSAQTEYPGDERNALTFETRNDWKSFARAVDVATQLTEATGKLYVATDAGLYTSPRFDVVAAPMVGDKVSKYFNGDSYPEGEIVKVSATLKRVETSTGCVFFRRGNTGSWVNVGTWSMQHGHTESRNPSF